MRTIDTYTTFTKIPILENSSKHILLDVLPITKYTELYMHCYDDLSNHSIASIYSEYNTFLQKQLIQQIRPITVMLTCIIDNIGDIRTYNIDITNMISKNVNNVINLSKLVDAQGNSIGSLSLSNYATASMNVTITTNNLTILGCQKLSMFVKLTDSITLRIDEGTIK